MVRKFRGTESIEQEITQDSVITVYFEKITNARGSIFTDRKESQDRLKSQVTRK